MDNVRIGDKYFNGKTMTEAAKILLNDIQKVEVEMGRLSLQTSIATLAKNTLIEKLIAEIPNLEEIDAPAPPADEALATPVTPSE
mgnify:CR=1 FL=1